MAHQYTIMLGPTFTTEAYPGTATLDSSTWTVATDLYPEYMSYGLSEMTELRIRGTKHPEVHLENLSEHQAIRIYDRPTTSSSSSGGNAYGNVIFDGVLVKQHIQMAGESEAYEDIAYDNATYLLHRACLHGQVRRSFTLESAYWTSGYSSTPVSTTADQFITIDTPCVFNPDGSPNCSQQTYQTYSTDGQPEPLYIFDAPFRVQKNGGSNDIKAVSWKLSWAVSYILNWTKAAWAIDPATFKESVLRTIFDTYGDPEIADVNVEGKSLFEALRALLLPHNYDFVVSPALANPNNPAMGLHAITFIYRGYGEQKQVRLPVRGDAPGNANVIALDLLIDTTANVNSLGAYGDRKTITTLATTQTVSGTMKLVKGWKDADLTFPMANGSINTFDTTFRARYCHPEMISVFDDGRTAYGVGRLWLVNQGEAPDKSLENLTTDFGAPNSIDTRCLKKPDIYNKNGSGGILFQEDIQVEMSMDGGTHWDIVENNFYRVMPEGLGIVFTEPNMELVGVHFTANSAQQNYWEALNAGTLQIRVLGSVQSDQRVSATLPNTGDVLPLATYRIYDNPGYKQAIYSDSINGSVYYTKFKPLKLDMDHTAALQSLLTLQKYNTNRILTSGTVQVITGDNLWEYLPGNTVSEVTNRLTFTRPPTIQRVVFKFQDGHTELALDSRMVKTIIYQKTQVGEDVHSHKIGVDGTHIMDGANKQAFKPGDLRSIRQHYIEGGQ